MGRGSWWATVHRILKNQTWLKRLSMHAFNPSDPVLSIGVWQQSIFIIICDCPASPISFIKEAFLSPVYVLGCYFCKFSSFQFSCSVVSNSLQPHEPQHTRPPCPSPTPAGHSNSCPLIQWCHPTISSSVVPFSSCPQSFLASRSVQVNQLFTSGGQRIGVSPSTSVLPKNTQDWSPLGWTGWISLQSKGLSRVFSNTTFQKHQFFGTQLSL